MAQSLFNLLVTLRLGVFLLGFVIAAQAFRGYLRNDSPGMAYLAGGFALISVRPLATIPLVRLVPASQMGTVTMALDVVFLGAAFLAIHYTLRLVGAASPTRPAEEGSR